MKYKNILLMHFKIGERDGVSLEIEKRAKIFRSLGATVHYITGSDGLKRKNAYLIEELNAEAGYNRFLREQCFRQKHFDENTMLAFYYQLEFMVYTKLQQAFTAIQPDVVFVHNMFSHGCNLPATTALIRVLDKYEIPTVAVHHDFWYERESLQIPQYPFIQEILDVLPPKREYIIKHQVINSLAYEAMQQGRKIQAEIIGDYFDFHQPIPQLDDYNSDMKVELAIQEKNLVILHATRITGHKVIENAILFAHEFEKQLRSLAPLNIAGKLFGKDSRVGLLFPNFVEPEAVSYYKALKSYQEELGVRAIWASDRFLYARQRVDGVKKYSFWDSYVIADLVTYTSIQEGFGNQFLEAVYFKKVPGILEYPVFEKDLKQEGYEYISFGTSKELTTKNGLRLMKRTNILQAVDQAIEILRDEPAIKNIVEKNFQIAKEHHDVALLKKDLDALITE